MEHRILEHVKNALHVAINWEVTEVGLPRKISSVRFTFQSYQHNLERLMNLEEEGGFMAAVADCKPNLHHRSEKIRGEHDVLRRVVPDMIARIESVSEHELSSFDEICADIRKLLQRLDRHDRNEIALIQEAFHFDEGGEG